MADKASEREAWFDHKVKFWIQIIIVIVGILGAWSTLDKNLALLKQKLHIFEENHLTHIEKSISNLEEDGEDTKDRLTAIEAKMEILVERSNP